MANKYTQSIPNLSNEELVHTITILRGICTPEEIKATEEEIKRRKIGSEVFDKVKKDDVDFEKRILFVKKNITSPSKRMLNYLIDKITCLLIIISAGFIVDSAVTILNIDITGDNLNPYQINSFITYVFLILCYYIFMEYKYQKTFGKFITKTKVVDREGKKPDLKTIVIRTLCRIIPLDVLSYLIMKIGMHDSLSDTLVVKDSLEQ